MSRLAVLVVLVNFMGETLKRSRCSQPGIHPSQKTFLNGK